MFWFVALRKLNANLYYLIKGAKRAGDILGFVLFSEERYRKFYGEMGTLENLKAGDSYSLVPLAGVIAWFSALFFAGGCPVTLIVIVLTVVYFGYAWRYVQKKKKEGV